MTWAWLSGREPTEEQIERAAARFPEMTPNEFRRVNRLAQSAYSLGTLAHVFLLVFFILADQLFMASYNVVSILVFAGGSYLHATDRQYAAGMVALSESIVHAVLAVVFVGLGPGFQFYLLFSLVMALIMPFLSRRERIVYSCVVTGSLIALAIYGLLFPPLQPLSTTWSIAALIANLLGACLFIAITIYRFNRMVIEAEGALEAEHERSEALLLNVLPAKIAGRLKAGEKIIADHSGEASILFADIVDFTGKSARMEPEKVVELLNEIFSAFDRLTERHDLEKIKTIGDAYMVAAGLPEPRADHAQAIARLALDMMAAARTCSLHLGIDIQIRIGINSGPVVSGVIGYRKFAYDLWGDTVNLAARMESTCEAGRIQITEETRQRLGDDYAVESRKGLLETYYLIPRCPGKM